LQFLFAHNNKLVSTAKVNTYHPQKLVLKRNFLHIVANTLLCKYFIYRCLHSFLQGKKN
jgi:hypothetical protein